jgi:Rad3-related DNA helicase
MPYNYLLNERMVGISKGLISNSIIIFDEGHNVMTAAA